MAPVQDEATPGRIEPEVCHNPSDEAMFRAVVTGIAVGVPVVFAIFFVIDLIAGLDLSMAAFAALLPAALFGGFIGAAVFIGRASDAAERSPGVGAH